MLDSLKTEFKTWFHLHIALLYTLLISGSFVAFGLFSVSQLKTELIGFEKSERMISDSKRMEQILNEPLYGNNEEENTLLLKKIKIEDIINSLSPRNAFLLCIEFGFYCLPLISTVIGAMTICIDLSSNVRRIRVAREGKWHYFFAKQIVMLAKTIMLALGSIILYRIVSELLFNDATSKVTSGFIEISVERYVVSKQVVLLTLFLVGCLIAFLEIGFSLGYIFKSPVIPVMFTIFLWFFNILPTGYEPKNAIYTIATKLIHFYVVVPNGTTVNISTKTALAIVLVMFFLPIFALLFCWEINSAYEQRISK